VRRVLASEAARDARLVSHVIPLLARDDLFGDVVKSLRERAPSVHRPAGRRAARSRAGRARTAPNPAAC
jgi:hypothetical protein